MTNAQIASLNLGISPIDERTTIIINAGLEWLERNTTIDTNDADNLPSCAKLFLIKFFDIYMLNQTVSSESISGLSQSYKSNDISSLISDAASELLGSYLISSVRFVSASNRW